jgi:hypothetical protein
VDDKTLEAKKTISNPSDIEAALEEETETELAPGEETETELAA